ncbi:MAG: hypothetical protein M0Q19_05115 [Candidatus Cloacimonetes bacterium]|nr:hypothetical protein [Candidatus Cloacimonadota bacterium]MCK9332543.1 hypothetical protein [Candidatus Cloacimonadota bacterium]
MALGTRFIKADFGAKVLIQTVAGTYIAPTKILCLEKGKAPLPTIEYSTYTCMPMDDAEYDIVLNADNSNVKISWDLALPLNASLGGVEDLMIACGMEKTDVTGTLHFAPLYDMSATIGASIEVTTKRRTYQIRDVKGTFTIDVNASDMVRIKFELNGTLNAAPVELSSATADNTIPTNYLAVTDVAWGKKSCGLTIGGNTVWAKSATLDLGRQIQTEDTFCGNVVVDSGMKPTAKVTLKMTEQNEAPISDMKNGTQYAVVIPAYNSAGVAKFSISVPVGQVSTPDSETDTNGYWDVERTFSARKTAGDDNFDLVFTA